MDVIDLSFIRTIHDDSVHENLSRTFTMIVSGGVVGFSGFECVPFPSAQLLKHVSINDSELFSC